MKIITLDLTGCKTLFELHERIQKAFHFPEWYGKNWDAFWDLMWSECDADKLLIKGEADLPANFSDELLQFHKVLEDTVQYREEGKPYGLSHFQYEVIS